MKRQRGRPRSILTQMRGEHPSEICAAIKRGNRAWRFLLLRELIKRQEFPKAPLAARENYFTWLRGQLALHQQELDKIFRTSPIWEARRRARQMSQPPIPTAAFYLWNIFILEMERAILHADEDWLHDLEKVLREGASPDARVQFVVKVIEVLDEKRHPTATATEIYDALKKEKCYYSQTNAKGIKVKIEQVKVEGYPFENRDRAKDAIRDIAMEIGVILEPERMRRAAAG
jgi:hypothetical protein